MRTGRSDTRKPGPSPSPGFHRPWSYFGDEPQSGKPQSRVRLRKKIWEAGRASGYAFLR